MTAPIIDIQQLGFRWRRTALEVLAVDQLRIDAGSRVFLRGPSGSGKSTLLGLIGGVLQPERGTLRVLDQDLGAMGRSGRDSFRGSHIGFIFQLFNLVPYLSVLDNVLLPCRFSKARRDRAEAKGDLVGQATSMLERLGLEPELLTRRDVTELSIGQQQRVAAARALIGAPELVIADEPTSAMDADTKDRFIDLLLEACDRSGATLLFVSHDPALASHFDRTLDMRELNKALAAEPAAC